MSPHKFTHDSIECFEITVPVVLKFTLFVEPIVVPLETSCRTANKDPISQNGPSERRPESNIAVHSDSHQNDKAVPSANGTALFHQTFWMSLAAPLIALALVGLTSFAGSNYSCSRSGCSGSAQVEGW